MIVEMQKFFVLLKGGKPLLLQQQLLGQSSPLKPQLKGGFLMQKDIASLAKKLTLQL
jgi:hypothetical protein